MNKKTISKTNTKRIKAIAISILSIAAIATECVIAPTVTANAVSYQFPNVIDLPVSAPTLDEANTKIESNSITVALNEQENVDGYQVTLSEDEDFLSYKIKEGTEPAFTFTELKPNTKYYFVASTFTEDGDNILYSQELQFELTTLEQSKPSTPSVTVTPSYFSLSIKSKSDIADGYVLQYSKNSNFDSFETLENANGVFTVNGLLDDTLYFVKAYSFVDTSSGRILSDPIVKSVKTKAIPKAEVSSKTTNHNAISFNLKKKSVDGYSVWVSTNKDFSGKKTYNSKKPSFSIKSLNENTTYYIKAFTYLTIDGKNYYSDAYNFQLTTKRLAAPSVKSLKSTYFTVSTTLKKANASGYMIYIADNKNFKNAKQLDNKTGKFTQKNLKQNKKYYVKAYAYTNDNGVKRWSKPVVKTIKTVALPKITVKSKFTNPDAIGFTFNKKNVDGYRIWVSTNKNYSNKKVYSSKKPSFTVKGLKANTTYYVKAATYVKRDGKNYFSNSYNFHLTTKNIKTPRVNSLKSTYFTVSAKLSKVKGATGYRIYIANNKNLKNPITITKKSPNFTRKNLKQNTTYYVKAYAYVKANGVNYWSKPITKTIKTKAVPTATVKSKSSTTNSISLTFNKKNVNGYCVWVSTNKSFSNRKTYSSKSNTFNIKNLKSGTIYYIKAAGYVVRGGKAYYSNSNNFSVSTKSVRKPVLTIEAYGNPEQKFYSVDEVVNAFVKGGVSYKLAFQPGVVEFFSKNKDAADRVAQAFIDLVNEDRVKAGLNKVKLETYDNINKLIWERAVVICERFIKNPHSSAEVIHEGAPCAENACFMSSSERVVADYLELWKNSPKHWELIMDADVTTMYFADGVMWAFYGAGAEALFS